MPAIRSEDIRAPAVAGMFYPEDPTDLRRTVETLLKEAPPAIPKKRIVAAVAPHAGYMYSGRVAAHTFKTLQANCPPALAAPSGSEKSFPIVVVIAPSHREPFPYISVFAGQAYRTPLGDVPLAGDFIEALVAADKNIIADAKGHGAEHALEVELPFLQVIWPQFRLVPIIMGYQNWDLCRILGEQLAKLARTFPAFILASSDLSHYHSYGEAVEMDQIFINHLQTFDPHNLHGALEQAACEACGGGSVVAAMIAAKGLGADTINILCYQNSGDVSGDNSMVVGYLAATFEAKR